METAKFVMLATICTFAACAETPQIYANAARVQLHEANSSLLASCKKLGPVAATVAEIAPADSVYRLAKYQAREQAATMGADTVALLEPEHRVSGLTNIVTVQGTAMKCY